MEYGSASVLAGHNVYVDEYANHMEVCKPRSKEDPSYELLRQFIVTCQKVSFNNRVCSKFH